MMNKSHSQPNCEASNYDDFGFDLQQHFSLLLEEAKQQEQGKLQRSSVCLEGSKKTGLEREKRGKKSWKISLISWWKAEKKSKVKQEQHYNSKSKVYRKRHGYVSGPMHNLRNGLDGKHRLPLSGPLTSLFKATKREEKEIPYMFLPQQNSPNAVKNYGPLYVVT